MRGNAAAVLLLLTASLAVLLRGDVSATGSLPRAFHVQVDEEGAGVIFGPAARKTRLHVTSWTVEGSQQLIFTNGYVVP